jgi:hypothetical protein
MPDHSLQLECDVLDDMREVGPVLEAEEEATRRSNAATVVAQSGQR